MSDGANAALPDPSLVAGAELALWHWAVSEVIRPRRLVDLRGAALARSRGAADQRLARVEIYPGVDHAFARVGGHRYDARAATIANSRTAELLVQMLG